MRETYLFMGGSRDGERLAVEPSFHISVLLPDNTEETYIRTESHGVVFYRPRDWDAKEAIDHLIGCYNSNRPLDTGERFLGLSVFIENRAAREGVVERFKTWLCEAKTDGFH